MKAAILINELSENALPDELDVLDEANVMEKSLHSLGYETQRFFLGLNLEKAKNEILAYNPDMAVNLFEGIKGSPELIYLGPGLLQSLKIPYTGCGVDSIFITSNKTLTKKILTTNNIPTAPWFSASEAKQLNKDKTYIVKPLFEDASVGITAKSIIKGYSEAIINEYIQHYKHNFFIEEYIDGREFNVSVFDTVQGPKMLSPAEMLFKDFPKDKPRILGYEAKWDENTFEYHHTSRTFEFTENDNELLKNIEIIALKCWDVFNLQGYARVDFRVDEHNQPYVLEINANPCISEDSGFYVALVRSGYSFNEAMQYMLKDLNE
jgi:D-alanine-D-alanine ligase